MRLIRNVLVCSTALLLMVGLLASSAGAVSTISPTPGSLKTYTISGDYVTGVSSGGYMAGQLEVAYSSIFKGAGIVAAGPYYCAQGNVNHANLACMNNFASDQLSMLEADASAWSSQGLIDSVSNLATQRLWVFHGASDTTVQGSVVGDLVAFYQHFGATVTYNHATSSGHAWVSPYGPNPCTVTRSPYLNNCGTDPEKELLGVLFGVGITAPNTAQLTGQLIQFTQDSFAPGGLASSVSMASNGYLYVPATCASGSACRLLVALHGCSQSSSSIQLAFVNDANLNQYADTNNFIVLYPQAVASPSNPNACWDWWGYLGAGDAAYAQHGGAQLEAIMRMVHSLGG